MKNIERDIEEIIKNGVEEGKGYWLTDSLQPPDRQQSEKNSHQIQLMMSIIFQHKFPKYDPKFMIAWFPKERVYKVAITTLRELEQ